MTQGKSLVEDMARALSIPEHHASWDTLTEFQKGLYRLQADYALQVLKDRLPADDRELVERLRQGVIVIGFAPAKARWWTL